MTTEMIAHNGLLRKEHYLAGFVAQIDDHVITIERHGRLFNRYGIHTPAEDIFKDLDTEIENDKAFAVEMTDINRTSHEEFRKRYGAVR